MEVGTWAPLPIALLAGFVVLAILAALILWLVDVVWKLKR